MGTLQDPLTADTNDTYDWAKVRTGTRQKAVLLHAFAGQPLPPITQALTKSLDDDGNFQVSGFQVDSSPRWVTLTNAQFKFVQGMPQGQMTFQLGIVAGKTTAPGRVIRVVGSLLNGSGMPGGSKVTEYFYDVV